MRHQNEQENEPTYKKLDVVGVNQIPDWQRRKPKWDDLVDDVLNLQPGESLPVLFDSAQAAHQARNAVRDRANLHLAKELGIKENLVRTRLETPDYLAHVNLPVKICDRPGGKVIRELDSEQVWVWDTDEDSKGNSWVAIGPKVPDANGEMVYRQWIPESTIESIVATEDKEIKKLEIERPGQLYLARMHVPRYSSGE